MFNFQIRNKNDLCLAYKALEVYKFLDSNNRLTSIGKMDCIHIKQAIRSYSQRETTERLVKSYDADGYIVLVTLPAHIRDEDAATAYFEEHMRIIAYPSLYDCTGRAFTCWYRIVERRDRFYVYHRIAYDV